MRKAAARRFEITLSTASVTRVLIVSYFIGLGFGLVEGARVDVLFLNFLPDMAAKLTAGALVVGLATLVLVPSCRRAAALTLAITIFWASYLTMVSEYARQDIAAFWRDLALIGGLLLTYGTYATGLRIDGTRTVNAVRVRVGEALLSKRRPPREMETTPVEHADPGVPPSSTTRRKRVRSEIYRQDFEVVRIR